MNNGNVNRVIEEFARLPLADKEYVSEILRKQVIESKRERLAARTEEARDNLRKGLVKRGGIKDLQEDLDSD
jgi:hypothetical protein